MDVCASSKAGRVLAGDGRDGYGVAGGLTGAGPAAAAHHGILVNCDDNPSALQAAISSAPSGATLWVKGTCVGNFSVGRDLTLIGIKDAVLDGGGVGTVVSVNTTGVRLRLKNLTVTHGNNGTMNAGNGGGIYNGGGTVTLTRVTVSNNTALSNGGGIFNASNSTITLRDSTVSQNSSSSPAGNGGGIDSLGALTLRHSKVGNNAAGFGGGGVNINAGSTADIKDTTIDSNAAGVQGGGVNNPGGNLTLSGSRLTYNTAGTPLVGGGGGGYDQDDGVGFITNTVISENTSAFAGGGIDHDGGPLTVSASFITNNFANGVPTGTNHPGGGGIWSGPFNAGETLTINRTTISGNTATSGDGGGIRNEFNGVLTLNNSTVSGNTAGERAGGLFNGAGSTANLKSSDIRENSSSTAPGGVYNAGTVTNTFSDIVANWPTNCTPSPNPVPGCVD